MIAIPRPGRRATGAASSPRWRDGSGAPVVEARGLGIELGGRLVVSHADLVAHAGEVVALVGPNGAGKSTVLAALAGDLPLAGGQVRLQGVDLASSSQLDRARRRAVLPQHQAVSFPFTAAEVVAMGRSPWHDRVGASAAPVADRDDDEDDDDEQIVAECLAMLDCTHLAHRSVHALSGGELARVAMARVLAQRTQLLLLDEPTAALDLHHQEVVRRLLRARAAAGDAVVVVLHDLGMAAAVADRVVLVVAGRTVAAGPPAEVLREELLSEAYGHDIEVFAHPRTGALLVQPRRGAPPPVPSP